MATTTGQPALTALYNIQVVPKECFRHTLCCYWVWWCVTEHLLSYYPFTKWWSNLKLQHNIRKVLVKQLRDKDTDILGNKKTYMQIWCKHAVIYVYLASLAMLYLLLHRAICNILLQFNVLRLTNNVLINWCWLLLLLLVSYCQRIAFLAGRFLPHSTVEHHSTNQCSNDEWHSTGDNCCDNVAGGTWALHTVI